MSLPLLDALHAHGESICLALEMGDFDEAGRLTTERQALVKRLAANPAPTPFPEAWASYGPAFAEQNRRIAALTTAQDRAFTEALDQTTQRRRAHTSYTTSAPASSRLRVVHG